VYIIAGDEFGDLAGNTLIIKKALYGLRSSGLRWHEKFADTLRDIGFKPTRADPDVWMRRQENNYEYIAVYVDDLAIAAKNPQEITNTLMEVYKYKLKGVGPIEFHLGSDFGRDPDGTMYFGPKKYVGKMISSYEKLFSGEKGRPPRARHIQGTRSGRHC
jgi:Reverse transcriptase (RNA-dependent DNA polymerase)